MRHTLFLACTRPTLTMGIPLEAFVVCLAPCVEIFFITGLFSATSIWRFIWLGGSITISYGTCRLLTAWDHNIFHILWIWVQTKGLTSRNAAFWGGSSISPARLKRPRKLEEIPYLG